jgi:hypothetical protein
MTKHLAVQTPPSGPLVIPENTCFAATWMWGIDQWRTVTGKSLQDLQTRYETCQDRDQFFNTLLMHQNLQSKIQGTLTPWDIDLPNSPGFYMILLGLQNSFTGETVHHWIGARKTQEEKFELFNSRAEPLLQRFKTQEVLSQAIQNLVTEQWGHFTLTTAWTITCFK